MLFEIGYIDETGEATPRRPDTSNFVNIFVLPTVTGGAPDISEVAEHLASKLHESIDDGGKISPVRVINIIDKKALSRNTKSDDQTTMQSMAQEILEEIKSNEPPINGPCLFFSYSSAGYLAMEMDRLLREDQSSGIYPYFILIDTMPLSKKAVLTLDEIKETTVAVLEVLAQSPTARRGFSVQLFGRAIDPFAALKSAVDQTRDADWSVVLNSLESKANNMLGPYIELPPAVKSVLNRVVNVIVPNLRATFAYEPENLELDPAAFELICGADSWAGQHSAEDPHFNDLKRTTLTAVTHENIMESPDFQEAFSQAYQRAMGYMQHNGVLQDLAEETSDAEDAEIPAP